ncbi:hypothetical protein QF91_004934 [Salmonella enterica subsp. salamae]|nr:hypothetical protein [Salmonella enterica]EDV0905638.1 hypothetical protein [Salmonella enterica subsp. salamae]EHM1752723.1 IS66 family transposase zinc-finger binding domain-containing protein [Salmonella enterica subsp. salamae serovar 40:c:e,n,x,z15]HCM2000297.1 IS66 family transposase zinc-finger binding domain-containing protein [Salmonella enterica subsp. salamae serovar [1],40:z35:e,n,x,z15]EIU8983324.1 IS66 family transposase zinc-finger binding domain-containing protein [Salmonella
MSTSGCACPDCGQPLRHILDEISERLEYIPAQFVVKRYVRQYRLSRRVSWSRDWWRRCWSASSATASRCITQ